MAINKVIYGGTTLIDLSGDSLASADQLMQGVTAHDRTGALITGTGSGGGVDPSDLEISVNPTSATGTAIVGTAETEAPNYTPGGDVVMNYEIIGKKLYIRGFTFVGSGVNLIIKEKEGE
mgnify:CR=1 FL=1